VKCTSASEKTEPEWTTKFAVEAPTARQRTILSTASAVGLLGSSTTQLTWQEKGAMISLTKAMATD
jgi:hypothetical protein